MTLTEFLLARIAEDEAVARAAYGVGSEHEDDPHWRAHRQPSLIPGHIARWQVVSVRECDEAPGYPAERITELMIGGGDEEERPAAEFIARHDPARVLAEVEAKRRIVAEAFEVAATIDGEWGCCHDADDIRRGYREPTPGWGDEPEPLPADCAGPEVAGKFLQGLALPYADHPDYDEAWRP